MPHRRAAAPAAYLRPYVGAVAGLALASALVLGTSGCSHDGDPTPPPSGTTRASDPSGPTGPSSGTSPSRGPKSVPPAGSWWRPQLGLTWQIQYEGALDTSLNVQAYNVDGEKTPAGTVAALAARGVKAICYLSGGSYEDWRGDKAAFPQEVRGKKLDDWKGEWWLDVRRRDVLVPIMAARMKACADKGFAAVDVDNVDGFANDTGFPLTGDDQLAYVRALAAEAHKLGLAYGLKNDTDQIAALTPDVDFAVNEQCREHDECDVYDPLVKAGKPVLAIEYKGTHATVCPGQPHGFSTLIKHLALDAYRDAC